MGKKKHKTGLIQYRKLLTLLDGAMRVLIDHPYGSDVITQDRYSFPESEFNKDVDSLLEYWVNDESVSKEQKENDIIIRQARYEVKHDPNKTYLQKEAYDHFLKIVFIEHGFEFCKDDWSKPIIVDELLNRVKSIMKKCLNELRIIYGNKIPWERANDLVPKGSNIENRYKHYEINRIKLTNEILEKEGKANPKLKTWDLDVIPPMVIPPKTTSKSKGDSKKYWFQWNGNEKQGYSLMEQLKLEGFIDDSVPDDLFISHCTNTNGYPFVERKEGYSIIWLEKKNTLADLFLLLIEKEFIPDKSVNDKIESLFVDKNKKRIEKDSFRKTFSRSKSNKSRKYNILREIVHGLT